MDNQVTSQTTDQEHLFSEAKNNQTTNQKHRFSEAKKDQMTKAKWIKNKDQRLGKAKRNRTSKWKINQTIENNCLAKPRIIANVWTNTRTITITANVRWGLELV